MPTLSNPTSCVSQNSASSDTATEPPSQPITLTVIQIQDLLPHRYPFLLVDRITDLIPGKQAVGIKNVTVNEPFFQGHFPGNPIMPGVLIVEAMAQVGVVLLKLASPDKLALFAGMDKIRFRRPVVPGDQLILTVEVLNFRKDRFGKMKAQAEVDGQLVAEGDLMCSLVNR